MQSSRLCHGCFTCENILTRRANQRHYSIIAQFPRPPIGRDRITANCVPSPVQAPKMAGRKLRTDCDESNAECQQYVVRISYLRLLFVQLVHHPVHIINAVAVGYLSISDMEERHLRSSNLFACRGDAQEFSRMNARHCKTHRVGITFRDDVLHLEVSVLQDRMPVPEVCDMLSEA